MARSGISISQDLHDELVKLSDDHKISWIRIGISEESFKLLKTGAASDAKSEFAAIQAELPPKEPAYFFYRVTKLEKWVLVFWCPDISKVKERMLYASSIAEAQKGFGESKFIVPPFYRISEPKEATWEAFAKTLDKIDISELLTREESMAAQAHMDSASSVSGSKVSAIMGMPVKCSDAAAKAITSVKEKKALTAILELNQETEVIEPVEVGDITIEAISQKMTRQDARFIIHNFKHQKEEKEDAEAFVYIYYCPDTAKPKAKLSYASANNVVAQTIVEFGVEIARKLGLNDAQDISAEYLLDELYPKRVQKKAFEKPKAAAGKKRGMIGGAKFSAGGAAAEE